MATSLVVSTSSASLAAISFLRRPLRAALTSSVTRFPGFGGLKAPRGSTRGCGVVTRAGASTSSYLLAFSIPLSLIAVTVFSSIKITDKLDEQFFQESAINEAMKEGEDGKSDEAGISLDEIVQEPVLRRTRNRPKREA